MWFGSSQGSENRPDQIEWQEQQPQQQLERQEHEPEDGVQHGAGDGQRDERHDGDDDQSRQLDHAVLPGRDEARLYGPTRTGAGSSSALLGGTRGALEVGRQGVLDHAGSDFFHRDPFELVMSGGDRAALEARQGAAAKLLGALRRDVDEKKPAGDRRRGCVGGLSRFGGIVLRHGSQESTRKRGAFKADAAYSDTSTWIWRGRASSRSGSVTVSTPSR